MNVEPGDAFRESPLAREAQRLLEPCVQCGQCTFTCPTFRLLDDEWDGPRGRIFLIKQFIEGREPDAAFLSPAYSLKSLEGRSLGANLQLHLDRCLTCRSCEASCPQGVRYGRLLDIARELVEPRTPRPWRDRLLRRLVRGVVCHPTRFKVLLRLGQMLRGLFPHTWRERIPARRPAGAWPTQRHARRMVIWQGCVQPSLAPGIDAAAARVLDHFGIQALRSEQGCCGALSHHLAAGDEARAFMRRTIDILWPQVEAGAERIVLTASGCGMHVRDYGTLLRDDPEYGGKARRISDMTADIAEVVAAEWGRGAIPFPNAARPRRIAFQSSCSLRHGEKLNGVVEGLLKASGFRLLPVAYPFMCCGAAGSYAILQRPLSVALRSRKLETLLQGRPEAIATANVGCLAHLAAVAPVPVKHWIELLDEHLSA